MPLSIMRSRLLRQCRELRDRERHVVQHREVDNARRRGSTISLAPRVARRSSFVGQYGGGVDRFEGTIDQVRIYGAALSQAEIEKDLSTSLGNLTAETASGAIKWAADGR
jgi:hypothetical protein